MKACLFLGVLLKQIFDLSASLGIQHIERLAGESVDIVCMAQQRNSKPSLLHLQSFTHLEALNISENINMISKIDGRIKISGYQDTDTVIVTFSNLKHTDTGLYICEFISENQRVLPFANVDILLLVKTAGEPRSCDRHSLVIYIMALVGHLLLLSVIALSVAHYKNHHGRQESQCSAPIYEDMGRKSNTANLQPELETAVPEWANNRQNMIENHYSSP